MLSVVCWKWRSPGFRSTYTAEHVHLLRDMVRRHYQAPHRFICITDDATGLDPDVEVVSLWEDFREIPSPHGGGHPSCYVRLKAFAPEMVSVLGERFVSVDLDCVVTGDLTELWNRDEDFVIWRHGPTSRQNGPLSRFNGSMWMLRAGTRPDVWSRFHGAESGREAYRAGYHGSDQGWFQYVMGGDQACWTEAHGVYSYKYQVVAKHHGHLPANARMVFFHGKPDPWEQEPQRRDWVREHYRACA
jgi:hypothetical protein